MREHNVYKNIVMIGVLCFTIFFLIEQGKMYLQEQKFYKINIQITEDLTEDIIKEFKKISGFSKFEPIDTAMVTIKLEAYTMEVELKGIELEVYPFKLETTEEKIILGNTAALFLGKESFSSFTDRYGYHPGKSQIEKWMAYYKELDLIVIDEEGHVNKGKICGILKEPENKICMDKNQMKEIFKDFVHTKEGDMEIYGYQNTKKAMQLLEHSGFMVEGKDLSLMPY